MDRDWMGRKLTEYLELVDKYLAMPRTSSGYREDGAIREELRRREPTVKEILKRLDPVLADFNLEAIGGEKSARSAAQRGLGVLNGRDEWAIRLAPDAPVLPADQLHPWIWEAARSLWESHHYRQAVQTAATALNARTQDKLSRRDLSDTKLMQAVLSTSPKPGLARLVVNTTGLADDTAAGMQAGVLGFAVGCFQAIRNPATHQDDPDWSHQLALEYLAAISVLARWIDKAAINIPTATASPVPH